MCKIGLKNEFGGISTSLKIGPKNEFGGILTSHSKLVPKSVWLDFEVSSAGYVAINRKLSHIPQIFILKASILAKNNSCQFSQISRKIYIVCKIGLKNRFGWTLKSHPLAMWQSIES